MTWRIVSIEKTAKLELRLGQLLIRGEESVKINLSEISVLIIENTACSLTAALLCELSKRKIKVIFCDEKRNPYGEIISYYGCHDSADKLRSQIAWTEESKCTVWTEIVKHKIRAQATLLEKYEHPECSVLYDYADNVEFNDITNREGHAAKVYFRALFGHSFSRDVDCPLNACLNYGYAVLLSAVNREITTSGYSTQLGIFHDNMYNHFNFGSDLMEPFRPIVDERALNLSPESFDKEEKRYMLGIVNNVVEIDNKQNILLNALSIYCKHVFSAIETGNIEMLRFHNHEAEVHEGDGVL